MNVGHPIAAEPEGGGYSCSGNWTPAGMCSTVKSLGEMLTHDTFTLFFGDHILLVSQVGPHWDGATSATKWTR